MDVLLGLWAGPNNLADLLSVLHHNLLHQSFIPAPLIPILRLGTHPTVSQYSFHAPQLPLANIPPWLYAWHHHSCSSCNHQGIKCTIRGTSNSIRECRFWYACFKCHSSHSLEALREQRLSRGYDRLSLHHFLLRVKLIVLCFRHWPLLPDIIICSNRVTSNYQELCCYWLWHRTELRFTGNSVYPNG